MGCVVEQGTVSAERGRELERGMGRLDRVARLNCPEEGISDSLLYTSHIPYILSIHHLTYIIYLPLCKHYKEQQENPRPSQSD